MNNSIQKINGNDVTVFSNETVTLIKNTVALPNLTEKEFEMLIYHAKRTGLDPLSRQIYCIKSKDKVSIQATIDGFRVIANRTGLYAGQTPVMWCDASGQWADVWLGSGYPAAAKVGVYSKEFVEPLYAIARWDTYAQKSYDGKLKYNWAKMPDLMLGKCAEALALRKAFPQELSNIYTDDEMANFIEDEHRKTEIKKISPSDFVTKVTGYLQTITKKDELEKAYETAKSRESYINCSDEDKQKIDEVYVECIGKFIEIPKPEDSDIPFDIPAEEVKAVFSVDDILPDELPEITGLKSCKTLTALNKYYKGITETPTFKQYGADYKAELHETYENKMKELKAK